MESINHFHEHGWLRVPQAFNPEAAKAMRDAVWQVLADMGIEREKPATWTTERPTHLQSLKDNPVFNAVGSKHLLSTIETILGQPYERPKNWGAFFIAFPSNDRWIIPTSGWHTDANYMSGLRPSNGVKTHALLGDIAPRSGGTLVVSGSHRLVHKWFKDNPLPQGTRSAEMRALLQAHPYICDLHTESNPDDRIKRFMERAEECEGISLRIVENVGSAGDVILMHPLTLHVAAPNAGTAPRFLLSGGVTTDMWGWGGNRLVS